MNAEQKQRAKDALQKWHSSNDDSLREYQSAELMAALLQELAEEPEPEPVARVTGYYAGYLSIATVDGRVLPAGTALYAAPPHQSEHHLEMVNTPAPSAPDEELQAAFDRGLKAGNEQKEAQQVASHRLHDLLAATPTQPEPPADLDAPEFSDGYEKEGFPGGCARMGCCKQLPATANPARTGSSQIEPPADLVRDAERWLSEHDLELLVTFGMQADDCDADGHTLSKEQTRRLCELGVLRNVGFGRHEMTAFGDSIFGVHFSQGISLPLQTHAEYNAAIEREKLKGQS